MIAIPIWHILVSVSILVKALVLVEHWRVPRLCILDLWTTPKLCILNIDTVHMLFILTVATVPPKKNLEFPHHEAPAENGLDPFMT